MEDEKDGSEIKSNVENLSLYNPNYPFNLSLRVRNFENEKEYLKFAKNVEKLVRGSVEYKLWRNYIIEVLQLNSCVLTEENIDELTIEIHHHVPSLFSIVKTVLNKFIEDQQDFSSFEIALEVIKIHFLNKLGYVPIIQSLHEKFHNGFLEIPIGLVKGNYTQFISEFGRYLDDGDSDVINSRLAVTGNSSYTWSRENYSAK
jgi:hypothetical protein